MPNHYFRFKQFTIHQDQCAMKVTTDACLFGAWVAERVRRREPGAGNPDIKDKKVLDIGAGTGLLSLMLAQKTGFSIDAVEIDPLACEQARENISQSPWKDRVQVQNGDIRVMTFAQPFDFIISNPPFYENELKGPDEKRNIAHHGHALTLADVFAITRKNLSEKGAFFLLLPYRRKQEALNLAMSHGLLIMEQVSVRPTPLHPPFRLMLYGTIADNDIQPVPVMKELSIRNEKNEYSAPFTDLLRDYYLHL